MRYKTKLRADNVLEIYANGKFIASAIFNGDYLNKNEMNKLDWHTPELRLVDYKKMKRYKYCLVGQTLRNMIKNPGSIENILKKHNLI